MPTSPSSLSANAPATNAATVQSATTTPRLWALIPCAGNGSRSGAQGPKQYQVIAGKPMVLHTVDAFKAVPRVHRVLVVVSAGDAFFDGLEANVQVVACGGATRAQTVGNGLQALLELGARSNDWVLVHDAARCLITPAQIEALIDACLDDAVGGLLALPLPDTLKQVAAPALAPAPAPAPAPALTRVAATLERADKWLAQTPQMFRLETLSLALQAAGNAVTDESSAMEIAGHSPLLVAGSAQNFKVTYPEDFALAQAVLQLRVAP